MLTPRRLCDKPLDACARHGADPGSGEGRTSVLANVRYKELAFSRPQVILRVQSVKALSDRCHMITMCEVRHEVRGLEPIARPPLITLDRATVAPPNDWAFHPQCLLVSGLWSFYYTGCQRLKLKGVKFVWGVARILTSQAKFNVEIVSLHAGHCEGADNVWRREGENSLSQANSD